MKVFKLSKMVLYVCRVPDLEIKGSYQATSNRFPILFLQHRFGSLSPNVFLRGQIWQLCSITEKNHNLFPQYDFWISNSLQIPIAHYAPTFGLNLWYM